MLFIFKLVICEEAFFLQEKGNKQIEDNRDIGVGNYADRKN